MTPPQKFYFYKNYRSTFHIFPAMIPLIEILPWLLGLIGGAAGVTEFLREKIWHKPRMRWMAIVSCACLAAGAAVYGVHQYRLPAKDTSVSVLPQDFSKLTSYTPTLLQQPLPIPSEFGLLQQLSHWPTLPTPQTGQCQCRPGKVHRR